MNNLIKVLRKNTEERKKLKKRYDDAINLSAEKEDADIMCLATTTNRLLDEGAIIEGDGSLWAYIKKGTLEKFMNGENVYLGNLPDDYIGNINIGHLDYATFPFPVGEWKKSDLKLVDIGDERKAIDIDVTLDEDSIFIKELKRIGYEVSMSVEAYFHIDYEASETLDAPVIDEVLIYAYAVVGDGKNVNSNGLQLKGEHMKTKEQIIEEEVIEDEVIEENLEAEEEIEEEVIEEESEEGESEEESTDELDEAEADETSLDDVLNEINELRATTESLQEQVASLTEANTELKKTNKRLSKKLSAEKEKKKEFIENAKGISVKLGIDEDEKEEPKAKIDVNYLKRG